jgi:hypothetical protein
VCVGKEKVPAVVLIMMWVNLHSGGFWQSAAADGEY